jgi:hypothetical protein
MYFKINVSGCQENKGCVEVRYDCYLSRTDPGNEEHYVTIPDFENNPPYAGKLDEMGSPVDQKDYDGWIASLPTITKNNPFCCHFRQFPETVTDEEILQNGENILNMSYANHQRRDLASNWNPDIPKITGPVYRMTKDFHEEVKAMDVAGKTLDLGEVKVEDTLAMYVVANTPGSQAESLGNWAATEILPKIQVCTARVEVIKNTDFTTIASVDSKIRG